MKRMSERLIAAAKVFIFSSICFGIATIIYYLDEYNGGHIMTKCVMCACKNNKSGFND